MKKAVFLAVATILLSSLSFAQKDVSWLRYPQISPDGKTIAFSYKGDIYTVDASGGRAMQITTNSAYDYNPKFSPDGKFIAFNSNRYGSQDIFIVPTQGGMPLRLTTYSGNEMLQCFSPDGKDLYYTAYIQHPAQYAQFPAAYYTQLYKVSAEGGRSFQVLPNAMTNVVFAKSGKSIIYEDVKGQENAWRKHHTSAVTRDIWTYDFDTKSFEMLTENPAEDRNPLFDSKEQNVYFLSERNGSFNVFYGKKNQLNKAKQMTTFTDSPIRFLSMSDNETLCFAYGGKIYTKAKDREAIALKIDIFSDAANPVNHFTRTSGATEAAFSPNGKEVAMIVYGDVYVTSVEFSITKQITNTPGIERSLTWSPDGKSIVYAGERNGSWNIYRAANKDEKEPFLFTSNKIEEEVLVDGATDDFQPIYAPNGKEVAFLRDRTKLCVVDVASKQVRQITDGSRNFSYSDGDQSFAWSPDSKWLVLTYMGSTRHPYNDIGIVSAKGGDIRNLTMSGYMNDEAKFAMKGNVIIFKSDRYGMRSHASWGSQDDVFAIFLNKKAMDDFNMSKEESEIAKEREKLSEEVLNKDKDKKKDSTKNDVKDIEIDWNNISDRIKRLTINSSDIGGFALTDDGSKLFYLVSFEKGYDLWVHDFKENETKLLEKLGSSNASLELDSKGEKLLVVSSRSIFTLDVKNTKTKKTVSFNAEVDADGYARRQAMLDHVVSTVADKFYNTNLHEVKWAELGKYYAQFLPYVGNYTDFSELLSELLGELNASHTGSGYREPGHSLQTTAKLGLLFDLYAKEKGLKVEEVLNGGVFDKADTKVKAGVYLTKINGKEILENTDYFDLLNGEAGKEIVLSFKSGTDEFVEKVKPVSSENEILYQRWLDNERTKVEKLSGGKLGYAHIRSMDDDSYRTVYSDILGRYNDKNGVVIDTRFNGGGRLHEDIEVLLSGKKYLEQVPRGQKINEQPTKRWLKPSVMLQGEANYSNAHGTPWVYKEMGIGKLVGMPVPGTMTSVWWENLPEAGLYYGIPIAGYIDKNGKFLENAQLEPDIKVSNETNILWQNRDQQLEEAVKILLQEVKSFKDAWKK
ncbi:tricorn protease [Bacteroidia bacterium]|nr:tricorn protease [Bacteroidia bacterium]